MSQPVKLSDSLVFEGNQVLAPCRTTAFHPLSEYLETVDAREGHERVQAYLATTASPHYRAVRGRKGYLRRIEADGKQAIGRFVTASS